MPKQTFFNLKKAKQEKIMKAAYKEFSIHNFQQAKISNIISKAKIPRGSFYQYFEDKKDIYLYIFKVMSSEKAKFLGDIMSNPDDLPFVELFHEIYKRSIMFTFNNPILMKIFQKLLSVNDGLYEELVGDNIKSGIEYYTMMIEKDKDKGLIRLNLNSKALAELVVQITTNITIDVTKKDSFDCEKMLENAENLMDILTYGVQQKS